MITSLDSIIKDSNIRNLTTEERIGEGYRLEDQIAKGNDHTRLFAWQFLYSDYLVEAAKTWQGQVLVDLGCGKKLDGYIISKIAGAKAYVAVDPYNISEFYQRLTSSKEKNGDKDFNKKIQEVREFIQNKNYDEEVVNRIITNIDSHLSGNHLPVALIAEDMVSAMRRLPNDSVSVMTAGIDNCIMWQDNYAKLAEEEIERILHPNGAYLAMCSRLVPQNLVSDFSFENDNSFKKFTCS